MRIGLITFHLSRNYGALLQAYALRKVLLDMGHEVQFINYRRGGVDGFPHGLSRRPRHFIPSIIRCRKLAAFRRQYLPVTANCYRSDADFEAWPPVFDAFICGSDQVWNAKKGFYPAYFLHFACDTSARLIAYGPSFGDYCLGSPHDEEMARLMKRFHSLSVREREGQHIISELTGRSAEHVLDPSLLPKDYASISTVPRSGDDYIVVYSMEISDGLVALVREAKEHFRLPAISLCSPMPGADMVRADAGLEEWLGYLQAARFVCTNSFHGTALSILFRRDFLAVPHSTRNARMACLLERVGLLHRQVSNPQAPDAYDQLQEPVSYDDVHCKLGRLRSASMGYLQRALTG